MIANCPICQESSVEETEETVFTCDFCRCEYEVLFPTEEDPEYRILSNPV